MVTTVSRANDWYVGGGGGAAAVHGGNEEVVTYGPGELAVLTSAGPVVFGGPVAVTRRTSRAAATVNLDLGYRVTPWLAIEADYLQPDRIKTSTTVRYDPADVFVFNDSWENYNLGVSAIALYPVAAQVRLFGGAGIGYSHSRESTINEVIFNGQTGFQRFPETAKDYWRPQLRAGVELSVNRQWSIRVGWDRPDGNLRSWRGYNSSQELTLNDFSATAIWSF